MVVKVLKVAYGMTFLVGTPDLIFARVLEVSKIFNLIITTYLIINIKKNQR